MLLIAKYLKSKKSKKFLSLVPVLLLAITYLHLHFYFCIDIESILPGPLTADGKKLFSSPGGADGSINSLSSPPMSGFSPVSASSAFRNFSTSTPSEQSVKVRQIDYYYKVITI